jgi:hypothetical protein
MGIKVKHLAAYLPYNVAVFADDIKKTGVKPIHKLHYGEGIGSISHVLSSERYKIVLRPLSEVENDEEVTPVDLQKCCYSYVEHLLSNHFDVFGMIPKGLAIDINKI